MNSLPRAGRRMILFAGAVICTLHGLTLAESQAQSSSRGAKPAWYDPGKPQETATRPSRSGFRWAPSRRARRVDPRRADANSQRNESARDSDSVPPRSTPPARNPQTATTRDSTTLTANHAKRKTKVGAALASQYDRTSAPATRPARPAGPVANVAHNERPSRRNSPRPGRTRRPAVRNAQHFDPVPERGSGTRGVPRQAQRGYASPPPSRHIHSSSRARQFYQDGPSMRAPEMAMPEEVGPDFSYDQQYSGGDQYYGGEGYYGGDEYYGDWAGGHGGCSECDSPYGWHEPSCGSYCNWWWMENFTVNGGTHAFKGPLDEGVNGNFGFGVGINWGGPLWQEMSIGWQFGWQIVLSDFEGDQVLGSLRTDERSQNFITAGIFHRPLYRPIQWGIVIDWMSDEYYIEQDLSQVRGEISFLAFDQNEFGFWGAASTGDDSSTLVFNDGEVQATEIIDTESTDLYAFFARRRFCTGTEGRVWAGFTGQSDGLLGADMRLPINGDLAISGGFNYLIPGESISEGGQTQESWGLVMNVVWYPGRTAIGTTRSPWRPLFNVADNSVFMVDRTIR